jgi:hypothetical protein
MKADTILGSAIVTDYLDVKLDVGVASAPTAELYDLLGNVEHEISIDDLEAPVAIGDRVGEITFTLNNEVIAVEPIVSFEAIEKPGFFEALGIWLTRLWYNITD